MKVFLKSLAVANYFVKTNEINRIVKTDKINYEINRIDKIKYEINCVKNKLL